MLSSWRVYLICLTVEKGFCSLQLKVFFGHPLL
uniref:Uncharacterized protein n=1 Tax=Anguilla anguilla TaxID=7936 RepID=A0A0E9QXH0_ANGAN